MAALPMKATIIWLQQKRLGIIIVNNNICQSNISFQTQFALTVRYESKNDDLLHGRCGKCQWLWMLQQDPFEVEGIRLQTHLQGTYETTKL